MLLHLDEHRLIDSINCLHSMLLGLDIYPTNTPAISAKLSILNQKEVHSMLKRNAVGEDYALAGWLRLTQEGKVGHVGQILYGTTMRLPSKFTTHWGDAEERAKINAHLNGEGVSFEINLLRDALIELCGRQKRLVPLDGLEEVRKKIINGQINIREEISKIFAQMVPNAIDCMLPEHEEEVEHLCKQIVTATIKYETEMNKQGMFRFANPFKKRNSLVGASIGHRGTEREINVYKEFVTLYICDDDDDIEHPAYDVKRDNHLVTEAFKTITRKLYNKNNSPNTPSFDELFSQKRSQIYEYELKSLQLRQAVFMAILRNESVPHSHRLVYEKYFGDQIRNTLEEFKRAKVRYPERETYKFFSETYPNLLSCSTIHESIVDIRALTEIVTAHGLAILDTPELLHTNLNNIS